MCTSLAVWIEAGLCLDFSLDCSGWTWSPLWLWLWRLFLHRDSGVLLSICICNCNWQNVVGTHHASAQGGSSELIVKMLDEIILKCVSELLESRQCQWPCKLRTWSWWWSTSTMMFAASVALAVAGTYTLITITWENSRRRSRSKLKSVNIYTITH